MEEFENLTDAELKELETQAKEEHEKLLEPYRRLKQQQAEQDELIAELIFDKAVRDLGGK